MGWLTSLSNQCLVTDSSNKAVIQGVPPCESCMYYACMPNVQVRDVPVEVHAELVRRAEQAGKSLQQFLTEKLELIATIPTLEDVLDTIEGRNKGRVPAGESVAALEAERARR